MKRMEAEIIGNKELTIRSKCWTVRLGNYHILEVEKLVYPGGTITMKIGQRVRAHPHHMAVSLQQQSDDQDLKCSGSPLLRMKLGGIKI